MLGQDNFKGQMTVGPIFIMTLDTQSDIRFHWHCTCHYICGNVAEMCKGKCRNSACVCRGPCQWGPVRLPYTHVGGFLLSQLKFLLCVFKSLGVLVKLILSSLELLLQSYQIVLKLVCVCVCVCVFYWSGGAERFRG